jgi:3-oxoacyl-[acyl-carrier protein] reductase
MSAPSPGPVAVVTGGSRRLGRHLCESLAARGYDLVILYRSSKAEVQTLVEQLVASGRRARAAAVDVGVERQVAALFEEIARIEGRVDLLVNNVGNYNPQPIANLDPKVWDETLRTNLSGAFYCCYHALKRMQPGSNIINIGTAGLEGIRANVQGTDYYVGKTGLLVLTRALAAANAVRNIRVNMVSPGQLENSVDLPPPNEIGRWVPLGRAGCLHEIARTVDYLLDTTYVTGVNIDVSGGYRL